MPAQVDDDALEMVGDDDVAVQLLVDRRGSTRPSGMPSTICFASDNELSELWRCVRVLMLDACDRERCARGRHVGVGMRCAEPEL